MGVSRSASLLVVAAVGVATTLAGLPAAAAGEPAPASGVLLIGHRGAVDHAPEHTLAAIDQAVAAHADRLSIDVHLTRDGVPVVIHDFNLGRTTNVEELFPTRAPWRVSDFTLAEIRRLDAGSWYAGGAYTGSRVLTLDELLTELAGTPTGLTVEAKNPELHGGVPGIGQAIMTVLAAHPEWSGSDPDGSPRLVLESFDWQFLDGMHAAYPQLPLVLLGDVTPADLQAHPYVREVDVRYPALTAEVVAAAHDLGMLVGAWTPDTRSDIQGVLDEGADGVTTDQVDLLRDMLAQQGKTWTGTTWPAPATVADVELDGPGEALLNGRLAFSARLADADGSPVRWQQVRFQTWQDGAWADVTGNASDATGTAVSSLPPSPQGTQVRASSGDAVSQPFVVPAARRQTSGLALLGPASVRDGSSATLTVQWLSETGQPVDGRVDVYADSGGGWSRISGLVTDHGVARLRVRPHASTTYQARAGSGWWWSAPPAARLRLRNQPVGPVVTPPPGAPAPSRRLAAQPRLWTPGARPQVSRLSLAAWRRMSGRAWRPGCPVGRAGLRSLHVTYWGFDGYRHRGQVVVARRSAHRLGRVFADLYGRRQPIRALRPVETLGTFRDAVGRALAADASFGFACQRLPGDTGRTGSHARGTVVSINPWENPTRLGGRGVPDSWWLPRRSLGYVHEASGPVVGAFAAQGFAWNGRTGRYAEFRDVR